MGNITNRTSNHQLNLNDTHRLENRLFSTSSVSQNVVNLRKSSSTIKMVLPDPESRQKLRQTYNGEILQAGGTLTGRQIPNIKNLNRRYSSASSTSTSSSSTNQKFPDNTNQNNNGLLLLKSSQTKNLLYKSEPDLRNYNNNNNNNDSIISNNKFKKKYKAPAPPLSSNNNYSNQKEENNDLSNQEELPLLRRARLFKTREESKKNSNNSSQYPIIITNNDDDQIIEENSSFIEDKILPNENLLNFSRPKYNSNNIKDVVDDEINLPQKNFNNELLLSEEIEQRSRDEPSGKESSIPELSPSDRKNNSNNNNSNKPNKVFYFGMENNNNNNNEDSDLSSNNNNNNNCYNNNTEDDSNILIEDSSSSIGNINLNLRPVLPRKRLEITHFSPITAWRQLDAGLEENYQNNHFDNSSRIYFWTPEQDLETNHSLDDLRKIDFSSDGYLNNINNRNKNNNHFNKHRAHVFSLSLPRDLTVPSSITTTINNNNNNNKNGLNSLKTFKRSVSDMINNLSFKKGINNINNNNEHHQEDDPNWFLSRSAPNSINGNSFESSDFPFMNNNQISSPRLMYLPDNNNYDFNDDNHCIGSSIYSKSCEDLQDFQPHHNKLMENNKTIIRRTISSKKKKFTFQSTIRQIERRRMAEKLSKEAEQKEKQRLREMEIMKRVEEEFQRKRDKEKANIRHQLRLYAMEEADQYISLPNVELNNLKLEEREEPDGASSPTIPNKIKNLTTTQELSEYRQMQRNYKEYRSCPKFSPEFKPTTVHKEITCKIPNIQERKKYRRDYLSGKIMRRSKSIDSVLTKF